MAPPTRGRPLTHAERRHMTALDAKVPRVARQYPTLGGYSPTPARDARSNAYDELRKYVSKLLQDGVSKGSLAVALKLSINHVRNWEKERQHA